MERVHLEEGVSLQCSFVASWPSFCVASWDYWDLVWVFFFLFFVCVVMGLFGQADGVWQMFV